MVFFGFNSGFDHQILAFFSRLLQKGQNHFMSDAKMQNQLVSFLSGVFAFGAFEWRFFGQHASNLFVKVID